MKFVRFIISLSSLAFSLYGIDFSPASLNPNNHSFGSLSIGGAYSRVIHKSGENPIFSSYESNRGAVAFGLKRGLMFGESQNVLLNAYLDGYAGSEKQSGFYAFSIGGQAGYIFFNRVYFLIGGGFEMSNLDTPLEGQYNIYGGTLKTELFIDISKGYGVSIAHTYGHSHSGKKLLGESFNTLVFMVALSYYDFSI